MYINIDLSGYRSKIKHGELLEEIYALCDIWELDYKIQIDHGWKNEHQED